MHQNRNHREELEGTSGVIKSKEIPSWQVCWATSTWLWPSLSSTRLGRTPRVEPTWGPVGRSSSSTHISRQFYWAAFAGSLDAFKGCFPVLPLCSRLQAEFHWLLGLGGEPVGAGQRALLCVPPWCAPFKPLIFTPVPIFFFRCPQQ